MFVELKAKFTYPTVVFEHSQYVKNITCNEIGLTILLTEEAAMNTIRETWILPNGGDSIDINFITFSDGCGASTNNVRTYWLGQLFSAGYDDTQGWFAQVYAEEILTEQSLTDADLAWGTYLPVEPSTAVDNTTYPDVSECTIPPLTGWPLRNKVPQANPCNANFDQALDDTIGYTYQQQYLRLAHDDVLRQNAANLPDLLAKANANQVSQTVEDNGGWLSDLEDLAELVEYVGTKIIDFIESWIPTIQSGDITIDVSPEGVEEDTDDWGPAIQMFKYPSDDDNKEKREEGKDDGEGGLEGSITVYCVDCGIHGVIHLSGSCSFSIADGVTSLSVGMSGSLTAGIQIGIDAEVKYTKTWSKELYSQGVEYLSVPNVITIGPVMTLDAALELELTAEGKVLTGAELTIGPFEANLDFINSDNTYGNGFDQTTFDKFFKASGEIGAAVTFSLPYSIGVGIDLPPLDWRKTISIIDAPGIKAEIKYENEISVGTNPNDSEDDSDDDDDCINGISWDVRLELSRPIKPLKSLLIKH